MPTADGVGYYAPEPYSSYWLWVGIALLAAVALWYVFVAWYTKPRPVKLAPVTGDRLAELKGVYAGRLDEIVAGVVAGTIRPRAGHQRISALVRHFVQDASGVRAPTMTLTDINRSGNSLLRPVSSVVGRLYPGEFGPDRADAGRSASPEDGAADPVRGRDVDAVQRAAVVAREVITGWTSSSRG